VSHLDPDPESNHVLSPTFVLACFKNTGHPLTAVQATGVILCVEESVGGKFGFGEFMDLVQKLYFQKGLESGVTAYKTKSGAPITCVENELYKCNFEHHDVDKDGRVDFQEWIDLIRRGRRQLESVELLAATGVKLEIDAEEIAGCKNVYDAVTKGNDAKLGMDWDQFVTLMVVQGGQPVCMQKPQDLIDKLPKVEHKKLEDYKADLQNEAAPADVIVEAPEPVTEEPKPEETKVEDPPAEVANDPEA